MKTSARIPNFYHSLPIFLLVLILPLASLAQGDPDCCVGRVGDANGIGGDEPTITDITAIIDAKFISPEHCEDWLLCVQEADINQSGGLTPTCDDITIGDIAILIDYLFITGSSLGLPDCLEPPSEPTGYLISNTGCKSFEGDSPDQHGNTQSCIQYDYDGTGTLSLTHVNAAFNCCPDYLTAVFSFVGNTITITEGENLNSGGCDCICLFDLQFQIDNLPPGEYHIIFEELYVQGEDLPLDFVVDLSQAVSDEYCVDRTHYPWGTEGTSGYLIGHTGCKSFGSAALSDPIPSDQDCLEYSYDEDGTLTFVHVNAGFNCCPTSLLVDFSFDGNTITITESENLEGYGCYCLCLFDLSYVITNLPQGEYNIVVEEPYLPTGDQPLEFTVDLTLPAEGTHCEARSNYPWGEM